MRKIPNTFGIDVTAARFLEYGSDVYKRQVYRCADHLMTDVTAEYAPAITKD